mmetsp:Transcript_475/g.1111  ORF Transcript_475/g.1111 Transcript_475/m.1111 type:complete len:397 (+) Transcript_475:97-1287(+)|eukprot:CAMPEP_0114464572 /NCGR_PEP_ID=MMETSP0104-20121206/8000_1 /TAXON_ID=37642 ORGANISM="Paraphysomonas imperforata, Strain PA2" /NCGR_SAMPLE_ID=MMETSP0104 /ASSEMBLY_ACC=CAM_ASM_000202 /LENGTH=396 /DNA_ID=CAMNT_0001637659 /DNA_START=85 /DNA_END=1275 /DNA_ORIENTATION=+
MLSLKSTTALMVTALAVWWLVSSQELLQRLRVTSSAVTTAENSPQRVFVDGSNMYNPSGGPEALLQLSRAFHSFLPQSTFMIVYKDNSINWDVVKFFKYIMGDKSHLTESKHPQFKAEYHDTNSIPLARRSDLKAGDILIIPEIFLCPDDLLARGVEVYMWILGANEKALASISRSCCEILSHNYWLSQHLGVNISATSVLRPYITPSLVAHAQASVNTKEDVVLIDNDSPARIIHEVKSICHEISCTAILVKGFTRKELSVLYKRAKVVIDWCMRGNERMPIEAVLNGALLLSSDCESIQDKRDFPVPERNIMPASLTNSDAAAETGAGSTLHSSLKTALERLIKNYHSEFASYEPMRVLHGKNISAHSLEKQTYDWYYTHRHASAAPSPGCTTN